MNEKASGLMAGLLSVPWCSSGASDIFPARVSRSRNSASSSGRTQPHFPGSGDSGFGAGALSFT